jgi:hypothetical protein
MFLGLNLKQDRLGGFEALGFEARARLGGFEALGFEAR